MTTVDKVLPNSRSWAVVAGVGLVLGLGGYGGGRLQAAAQVRSVEQRAAEAEESAAEEARAAARRHDQAAGSAREARVVLRARMEVLEQRMEILEARRQLGLVLTSLDDMNFGIASRHLDRARSIFESANLEGERAAALVETLSESEIVVSQDIGAERRRFRALVQVFDELIDSLATPEPLDDDGAEATPEEREGGAESGEEPSLPSADAAAALPSTAEPATADGGVEAEIDAL